MAATTLVLALQAGCSQWPRFASPSQVDAVPSVRPFSEAGPAVVEPVEDFPDEPLQLRGDGIQDWYSYLEFSGTLDPDGPVDDTAAVEWPPCRAGTPGSLPLDHQGDIDWVSIFLQDWPTCVAVAFDNLEDCGPDGGECLWDVLLYRYDPDADCTTGPFLNPAAANATDLPGPVKGRQVLYFDRTPDLPSVPELGTRPAEAGAQYAIAISGVLSGPSATRYGIRVAHAPTLEACLDLATGLEPTEAL
jgi:hypothetical protein